MREITMSVEEWEAVRDNPIQRDTERHACFAKKRHLANATEPQALVSAADVKGVGLVKLDGHTRALLWARGELKAPAVVRVTVYEVDTINEAVDLYGMFDNASAVETPADRVFGAYRLNGIEPHSGLLKYGSVTSAFRCIQGTFLSSKDIYYWVAKFKPQLEMLDGYALNHNRLIAPLLAAALIGTRKHGEDAIVFFQRYCNDSGSKIGDCRDAVEALSEAIKQRRAKGQIGGQTNTDAITAIALAALEKFLKDDDVRRAIKPLDLRSYINLVLYQTSGSKPRSAGVERAALLNVRSAG